MAEVVKMKKIAVAGSDARQAELRRLFKDELSEPENADAVILPMPASGDFEANVPANAIIIGGRIDEKTRQKFAGHRIFDYAEREDFAILNALATAEAAIWLLLDKLEKTLAGSSILVVGNGRIGKLLAEKLRLLGADVTVSARRNSDLALIETAGHRAVRTREIYLHADRYDAVVNTVPAPVIDRRFLAKMKKGAFIIDLASMPGGTDFEAAKELGIPAEHALALPGKTAPVSAAEYAYRSIRNIFSEVEDNG